MPRDLFGQGPLDVSHSHEDSVSPGSEDGPKVDDQGTPETTFNPSDYGFGRNFSPLRSRTTQRDELHPFPQILSVSNVEDCVKVEDGAFPPHERCSREKFTYRLTKCPELSLGLFSLPKPLKNEEKPPPTLLAHIVATQTTSDSVTDASMALPDDWQTPNPKLSADGREFLGHQVHGRTIAVHSLAVSPAHQRKGLGKTLMRAYIQRMEDSGVADRIVLLAHDPLVSYYEALGFTKRGKSPATFGGGGWNDMVYEIKEKGFGSDDE